MPDDVTPPDKLPADVLAARARQSLTLDSIGRLSGGIAHEFNNLLTSIFGYSELLDDQLRMRGGTAAERSDLLEIRKAAERALQFTQRLLAFSRHLPVAGRLIDANQVATGLEPLLRRFVSPHIEVVMALSPECRYILADPAQLEQVLLCLVVNACDAMPAGGKLTVATAWCDVDTAGVPTGEVIGTPGELRGEYVELSVQDIGTGMRAGFVHQAFEPFVTTKDPAAGRGLGLSEVYGLVTRAGGAVVVQSEPGLGTVVRVLLPRVQSPPDGVEMAEMQRAAVVPKVILLADSDARARTVNGRALREAGYTVLDAADGGAALEIVSQRELRIDLVIAEAVLSVRSGWDVAHTVHDERPEAPVLMLSALAPDLMLPDSLPERGVPFLAKPFTPSLLLHRVRQLLEVSEA